MKKYGGVEVHVHVYLILILDWLQSSSTIPWSFYPQGKSPYFPLVWRLGGSLRLPACFKENSLLLPGIKIRFLGLPVSSLVTIPSHT